MSTFHRIIVVRYGYESKSAKFRELESAKQYITENIVRKCDCIIHCRPDDRVDIMTRDTAMIQERMNAGPYSLQSLVDHDAFDPQSIFEDIEEQDGVHTHQIAS